MIGQNFSHIAGGRKTLASTRHPHTCLILCFGDAGLSQVQLRVATDEGEIGLQFPQRTAHLVQIMNACPNLILNTARHQIQTTRTMTRRGYQIQIDGSTILFSCSHSDRNQMKLHTTKVEFGGP